MTIVRIETPRPLDQLQHKDIVHLVCKGKRIKGMFCAKSARKGPPSEYGVPDEDIILFRPKGNDVFVPLSELRVTDDGLTVSGGDTLTELVGHIS